MMDKEWHGISPRLVIGCLMIIVLFVGFGLLTQP